jgi:Mce-associated membrane protein
MKCISRYRAITLGAALVLLYWAVLGQAACSSNSNDDEHHRPNHDHVEHYSTPPGLPTAGAPEGALTSVLSTMFSWEPVTDVSPTDAWRRAAPRLTGHALASAHSPDAAAVRPSAEWGRWRSSGDLITARVQNPQATITGPGTAFGRATITQTVLHQGGGSTPYRSFTVTAQLRQVEGIWKLATYPDIAE